MIFVPPKKISLGGLAGVTKHLH